MRHLVALRLLTAYWNPKETWGHTSALAPFFAVHGAYAESRTKGHPNAEPFRWEWDNARAVEECLQAAWHMTGKWNARRPVTMKQAHFERRVLAVIPPVARHLNNLGIHCLGDLAALTPSRYRRVANLLQGAVASISKLRATKNVEPVLGSKVMHHYFPSLVPVFDTALVRIGVMRMQSFRAFVDEDVDGWLLYRDSDDAGGNAMLEYHRYFAFAAAQVAMTPKAILALVRRRFGRDFSRLAPSQDVARRDGLVWRLDAKLAEYCLIGQAEREGLI
jgi:hypothetical protein